MLLPLLSHWSTLMYEFCVVLLYHSGNETKDSSRGFYSSAACKTEETFRREEKRRPMRTFSWPCDCNHNNAHRGNPVRQTLQLILFVSTCKCNGTVTGSVCANVGWAFRGCPFPPPPPQQTWVLLAMHEYRESPTNCLNISSCRMLSSTFKKKVYFSSKCNPSPLNF